MNYFFFFNDTATTEIYTLSLHDALPILPDASGPPQLPALFEPAHRCLPVAEVPVDHGQIGERVRRRVDRKSTRLNSSHLVISYAVFCLKKKKNKFCHYAWAMLRAAHIAT